MLSEFLALCPANKELSKHADKEFVEANWLSFVQKVTPATSTNSNIIV